MIGTNTYVAICKKPEGQFRVRVRANDYEAAALIAARKLFGRKSFQVKRLLGVENGIGVFSAWVHNGTEFVEYGDHFAVREV